MLDLGLFPAKPWLTILYLCLLSLLYLVLTCIHRLLLHPLSRFPGPRLAAVTTLYRAYYQVQKDGKMVEHSFTLHKRYGPVVRIAPNELHFDSLKAYDDIFRSSSIKDPEYYEHLCQSEALFGMTDPDIYRARRKPIATLFAKLHIDACELMIRNHLEQLSKLLEKCVTAEDVVNMSHAYRSLFIDIVIEFIYGARIGRREELQAHKFQSSLAMASLNGIDRSVLFARNFLKLHDFIVTYFPESLTAKLLPGSYIGGHVDETLSELLDTYENSPPSAKTDCLMARFITHDGVKLNRTHPRRIILQEASGMFYGGFIDLTNALSFGTYQLCKDPVSQRQLWQELRSVWAEPESEIPPYSRFQALPCLTGVVKESLRLTHGVISGPPRRTTEAGLTVDGVFVPPQTTITTSSTFLHLDASVFPNPLAFLPERWMGQNKEKLAEMEHSLVPFGRGRRMCPAVHMAYMELYLTFAVIFRRYSITAFQTSDEDFEYRAYLSLQFCGTLRAKLQRRSGGISG